MAKRKQNQEDSLFEPEQEVVTKSGRVLTPADVQALADACEVSHDLDGDADASAERLQRALDDI